MKSLEKAGMECEIYDEVEVEPTDRSFKAGSRFASEGKFDGFVSVGGGSVMDTCKASNLYSCFPSEFLDYVNAPIGKAKPVPGPLKPHIACPTTFGTASECTGIAIFDLLEMEAKTGIVSPRLRPDLGLLDPHTSKPNPLGYDNNSDDLNNLSDDLSDSQFFKSFTQNGTINPLGKLLQNSINDD